MINYSIVEGDYLVSCGSATFESDLPIPKSGQTLLRDAIYRTNGNAKMGERWNIHTNAWEDARSNTEKAAAKTFEIQAARYSEYPSLGDFADAMYHNSRGNPAPLADYFNKCEAVKQKHPKPND